MGGSAVVYRPLNAKVLGVSVAQFRVNFDYDNGVVTQWDFRLGFGVPLLIARAEGTGT
jgi:hypothetical protein